MRTTTAVIAIIGGLTLVGPLTAHAQTPASPSRGYLNISAGGQFQTSEFSSVTTFELFDETGTVTANQTVDGGFVFDATGGYRVWPSVAVAVGVSTFSGSGSAAAVAAIPNPLFFGVPTIKEFDADDYGDLNQSTVSLNFQLAWIKTTGRWEFSIFGGPTILYVKQDIASATAEENSVPTIETQSKTTGKAGTVGVDLSYWLNDRYGIGGFVRYAGGQVDLPAVPDLAVGGGQAGGGIRVRF